MERSAGERGKGFYWTVEADCERMFEEQEARAATSAAAGGKDFKVGGRKGKSAAALESPFKRSVRGEPKGAPRLSHAGKDRMAINARCPRSELGFSRWLLPR